MFEESAYPANSEGITLDSSTAVHGLHMQSAGALVTNYKKIRCYSCAFIQRCLAKLERLLILLRNA